MTHRIGRAAVLAAALLAITAGGAFAHEERDVGDYSFEVGFIDEPVFTGQKSGLEFFVVKRRGAGRRSRGDARGRSDIREPDP